MSKGKSIARHEDKITASSSSNDTDDHKSLGADQEQTPKLQALTHDSGSSSVMTQHQGVSLHNEIHLPTSTRSSGRMIFQCMFVLLS
jgi:hypothetical protein